MTHSDNIVANTAAAPAILALEDGTVFYGKAIGAIGETVGEVVFNTSMTGYQEILTDPSYKEQIVTLTYPHIGNVGTNAGDEESDKIMARGLVIRDLPRLMSSWRGEMSLADYLIKHNIVAIADIDTRKLTRLLRDKGAQNGAIVAVQGSKTDIDKDAAIASAQAFPGLKGMDLARVVTTDASYEWAEGSWSLQTNATTKVTGGMTALPHHVVAYDYGVKKNILRMLVDRGCKVTVVPAKTKVSVPTVTPSVLGVPTSSLIVKVEEIAAVEAAVILP